MKICHAADVVEGRAADNRFLFDVRIRAFGECAPLTKIPPTGRVVPGTFRLAKIFRGNFLHEETN
jgi:hypothetical protein